MRQLGSGGGDAGGHGGGDAGGVPVVAARGGGKFGGEPVRYLRLSGRSGGVSGAGFLGRVSFVESWRIGLGVSFFSTEVGHHKSWTPRLLCRPESHVYIIIGGRCSCNPYRRL